MSINKPQDFFAKVIVSIIIVVVFSSCRLGWKNIQKNPIDKFVYDSLPLIVKDFYELYVKNENLIPKSRKIDTDIFNEYESLRIILVDSTIHVGHFNASADATKRIFWPWGDYFKINRKKLFLPSSPSHPYPFIIDEKYIYYPSEFNLGSRQYKSIYYYRVLYSK